MLIFGWIRFALSALFIVLGLVIICIALIGLNRFNYVLNRMHIGAACDTLGLLLILIGMIIMKGFDPVCLKFLLIIVFFWLANPVSSHLICEVEVKTNKKLDEECEVINS